MQLDSDERAALYDLLAKDRIRQVLHRYCRAIDRCDDRLLESVFHEDAVESHGGLHEGSAQEFCRIAMGYVRKMGAVAHYLTNMTIEVQGNVAWAESYGIAVHRIGDERDANAYDSIVGARLLDRLECRNGEWRISARRVVYDWNRDTAVSETWGRGFFAGDPQKGTRNIEDPSYSFWAQAHISG